MAETWSEANGAGEELPEGLQLLLARLGDARPSGPRKWSATCPRHQEPMGLQVRQLPSGPWICCGSGCSMEQVLTAVGISANDAHRGFSKAGRAIDPLAKYLELGKELAGNWDPDDDEEDLERDEPVPRSGGTRTPRSACQWWDFDDVASTATPEVPWEAPIPFHEQDLPSFPVEALPDPLAEWVTAEAASTQTPPDLSGMLLLAALAAACAGRFELKVREDWVEPLNLFVAVSLPPGERKSAVFAHVTTPLEAWEAETARRGGPAVAAAQSELKILEARLQKVQQAAARAPRSDRPALEAEAAELAREISAKVVPALPRMLADDTSPERLASLLREQGGRMAVLSPEGGVFDLMAGRYAAGGLPNFEVFLKGHAGDPLRVDRIGRPAEYVRRPALTLGLALQPDVLRGLADRPGFRGRGLLGRFLYSLPPTRMGERVTRAPEMPPAVRQAYTACLATLLGPPPYHRGGETEPRVLTLTEEAQARLYTFSEWLEPELGPHGDLRPIADWAGKLAGAIARIAALLHLADHAGDPESASTPVSLAPMERAVRLGKYLIPHARAAFQEMGADPDLDDARYLLEVLRRREASEFSRRELYQWARGRFRRVEALDPGLRLLEQHFYARPREGERAAGKGRPASPAYEVNPEVVQAWRETRDPRRWR